MREEIVLKQESSALKKTYVPDILDWDKVGHGLQFLVAEGRLQPLRHFHLRKIICRWSSTRMYILFITIHNQIFNVMGYE